MMCNCNSFCYIPMIPGIFICTLVSIFIRLGRSDVYLQMLKQLKIMRSWLQQQAIMTVKIVYKYVKMCFVYAGIYYDIV